ncbi:MAG: c-type cytochrome, partial [Gammaproteobacteria bacterium]|nr:c-type cytochrome [Gammaproteobacteria bacterium]
ARDLQPNLENGRRIFRYCVECHGPEAWGDLEKEAPQTAGQHASVIIKQLRDIHTGLREVTPMIPFADPNLLGGAQGIADIAGFLNRLPMTPTPEQGDGKQVAYGGSLYKTYCARSCHGKAGEGNAATRKPRIQGQHYTYLLRQLKHIRDGVRRNANKAMVRRLQGMTDDQLAAMADFVSRLSP